MKPWLEKGAVTLYHGDALETLRTLPDCSVQMIASSPPFWGLRDYGTGRWEGGNADCDHKVRQQTERTFNNGQTDKQYDSTLQSWNKRDVSHNYSTVCGKCGAVRVDSQIGLEESPDVWVERLVAVFRECRRVLRDDGVLFVEIGDSYASGQGAGVDTGQTTHARAATKGTVQGFVPNAWGGGSIAPVRHPAKPKDLVMQPALLAKALRDPYYTGKIRDERDRVWLAAMIDAEGCIYIQRKNAGSPTGYGYGRKTDSYSMGLTISNTNEAIVARCVEITGLGRVRAVTGRNNQRDHYEWRLHAQQARSVIHEAYPHLVAKKHEARLAFGCPTSGEKATAAHEALKLIHQGSDVTVDLAAPPTLWEEGWFLRSEIIWARLQPNPMPESVTDRPTKAHSTVFLLTKRPRYYYDADAIREPYIIDGRKVTTVKGTDASEQHRDGERWPNPSGANARSVWSIPTEPTPFAHFATWPQTLIERMIKAGTSEKGACEECGAPWVRVVERSAMVVRPAPKRAAWQKTGDDFARTQIGGTVEEPSTSRTIGWEASCSCGAGVVPCVCLDPFMGSGTTALVARRIGRHSIGIELNEEYLGIARGRLSIPDEEGEVAKSRFAIEGQRGFDFDV